MEIKFEKISRDDRSRYWMNLSKTELDKARGKNWVRQK